MLTGLELATLNEMVGQGLREISKANSSYTGDHKELKKACAPFRQALMEEQHQRGDPEVTKQHSIKLSEVVLGLASDILQKDFDKQNSAPEQRDSTSQLQKALAGVCKLLQAAFGYRLANGSVPTIEESVYFDKVLGVANYNHRVLRATGVSAYGVLYRLVPNGPLKEQLDSYLMASQAQHESQTQGNFAGPSNLSQQPVYGDQLTFSSQAPVSYQSPDSNPPRLQWPGTRQLPESYSYPPAFSGQAPFSNQGPYSYPPAFSGQAPFSNQGPYSYPPAFSGQAPFVNQTTFSAPPNSYPGALHHTNPSVLPPDPSTDQSLMSLLVRSGAFSPSPSPPPQGDVYNTNPYVGPPIQTREHNPAGRGHTLNPSAPPFQFPSGAARQGNPTPRFRSTFS